MIDEIELRHQKDWQVGKLEKYYLLVCQIQQQYNEDVKITKELMQKGFENIQYRHFLRALGIDPNTPLTIDIPFYKELPSQAYEWVKNNPGRLCEAIHHYLMQKHSEEHGIPGWLRWNQYCEIFETEAA